MRSRSVVLYADRKLTKNVRAILDYFGLERVIEGRSEEPNFRGDLVLTDDMVYAKSLTKCKLVLVDDVKFWLGKEWEE